MKNVNLFLSIAATAILLTLSSCTDDCKDVVCENSGVCVEGVCDCPDNFYGDNCDVECVNGSFSGGSCNCEAGFEGDACKVESRTKFLGTYSSSGTIVCGVTGNGTFNSGITVVASSASNLGLVITFGGEFTLTATVTESGLSFASQQVEGYNYNGTGSINGTSLTLSLSEYDATIPETCVYNINATKQ